jgi:outer membrane receptor protein involved in Fe transport
MLAFLGRRPVESGGRVFNQDVETGQFSSGFKGYFNLGGNEWDWDLGYTYGDNTESDITTGLFNTERLATALDSPGVASCASQKGCVPFNIFGGAGSITPAMLNYVLFEAHDVSERQMRDYTGNINGSIADLPAGPLGLALGYEYLEFNGFAHPDATTSSGNTSGNVTQPTDGREKTAAEYIEFDIPIVADAPGFKMLDLDVANRWSQFQWKGGIPGSVGETGSFVSHFAHASTGRAALKWQPTDSLLVRASWSQGFRAPSISDLFFGASDSFPQAQDPCATTPTPASCPIHHSQPNQQIRSTVGGNKDLQPEHATSKSIGFVYNPDFIPGFDFSLDYYHIELDNEITAVSPQIILNGCYPSDAQIAQGVKPNLADCSKITVTGNSITDILDTNLNIGGIVTDGYDVAAHYKFPSTSAGDFKLGLDWTFLKNYIQTVPNSAVTSGFSTSQLAGNTTGFGGFPKQRANLSLNWNYGDWSANWNMEYIHSMYEGCTKAMIGDSLCSDPGPVSPNGKNHFYATNYLGNTIYHDVQGSYHFDDWNTDFTLGIRNLFDKAPPTADTAFANSFLPAFYRVPGREFYGRISVKF